MTNISTKLFQSLLNKVLKIVSMLFAIPTSSSPYWRSEEGYIPGILKSKRMRTLSCFKATKELMKQTTSPISTCSQSTKTPQTICLWTKQLSRRRVWMLRKWLEFFKISWLLGRKWKFRLSLTMNFSKKDKKTKKMSKKSRKRKNKTMKKTPQITWRNWENIWRLASEKLMSTVMFRLTERK